jgi:hypothetical protein
MKRFGAVVIAVAALGLVPVALAAGGLSGKYKTKITGDHAFGGGLNGTWKITFTSGHYKVTQNSKPFGDGTDRVKGDKITFLNGGNCSSAGKYKFNLTGKKLTFTTVNDPCAGRRAVMTLGPFNKVS